VNVKSQFVCKLGFSLRCFALLLAAVVCAPAHADTFVVSNTADAGAGSLRKAIQDANAKQVTGGTACAPHTIAFNIPGSGPHSIRPLSPLPRFNIPITLDGYSQPGASHNTLPLGSNAVIAIELDGSLAGLGDAIVIGASVQGSSLCGASGSAIVGLAINRFAGAAISMGEEACVVNTLCNVGAVRIQGNYIGTDVTGTVALGNGNGTGRPALLFGRGSSYNIVGDQILADGGSFDPLWETRNVISGNAADAIWIGSPLANALSEQHRIRNNYIGVAANGSAALPNGGRGIVVDVNSAAISIHDNLISANVGAGVVVLDSPVPGTMLVNNGIGIGAGAVPLGNGGDGVFVAGNGTVVSIGGRFRLVPVAPSIANNAGAGVFVTDLALVDASAGSIAGNAGLAIDLAPAGVNPNDAGDGDVGPSELLNFPIITSAIFDSSNHTTTITGTLNAAPNSSYQIGIYLNDVCDPSGFGGGQTPFPLDPPPNVINVSTDATGNASFVRQTPGLQAGRFLTALTRGFSTVMPTFIVSEFSACRRIVASGDLIFLTSFE
jgi:hypothetical protein